MVIKRKGLGNKHFFIGLFLVVVIILAIYFYFRYQRLYPETEDAYVGASLVNVAPKVSGYLKELNVKNNQFVHQGDLLFTIESKDYNISLKQAQSNYDSQVEACNMALNQIDIQKGQIQKDSDQYKFLADKATRFSALYKENTVSKQAYQEVMTNFDNIKTQLAVDNKKYTQFLNMYKLAEAKKGAAAADVDKANTNLSYTKYYAPMGGNVSNMNTLAKGEFITASQQLFGIVDMQNWWVDANFKETQLARVKIGQHVKVKLDMYAHTYDGVVQSISYASGNVFSLLPAQNATGNWVKVTQRFTVRISLQDNPAYPLRVGASATVKIDTQ